MKRQSEKAVRVLFVVRSLHVGGMERMVIELAAGLNPTHYQVRFCTIEDPGQLADHLQSAGILLDALNKPPGLRLGYVRRLRAILDAWRPDIIHTHNDTGHFYASLANVGRGSKARLLHTKHGRGDPDDRKSVIRNWLSSRLSDVVIAVSDDVEKICREVEKVPAGKVRTIINGIKLDPYLSLKREGPASGAILFGHVGRLSEVKNQRLLIEAFAIVHRQLPQSRLAIAGDGPLRSELEEQTRTLGIASSVDFLGYRSDVAAVLSDIDVFLLSSQSEGTPLVVIEAMAAGIPVIATDVGGLSEMLKDRQTGMLVPPGDARSLANRMLELASDKEKRYRLGERGRENAKAHYSLERMIRDYSEIYESLLPEYSQL
ncbi:MAG: glycosyltransferase [Hyphomicrobiaceae bacterium]